MRKHRFITLVLTAVLAAGVGCSSAEKAKPKAKKADQKPEEIMTRGGFR